MTTTEPHVPTRTDWVPVCPLTALTPDRGVAALVGGEPVAVFHLSDGRTFALGNLDPFSGASVLSRGLVGDVDGEATVASPMYKQRFALDSGRCLDVEGISIPRYDVRVVDEVCHVRLGP